MRCSAPESVTSSLSETCIGEGRRTVTLDLLWIGRVEGGLFEESNLSKRLVYGTFKVLFTARASPLSHRAVLILGQIRPLYLIWLRQPQEGPAWVGRVVAGSILPFKFACCHDMMSTLRYEYPRSACRVDLSSFAGCVVFHTNKKGRGWLYSVSYVSSFL